MSQTSRLGLPYIITAQAQKEVTHNDALNRLDAFITPVVQDILNTPPVMPTVGSLYIVGTIPTGDFTGQNNKIAQYQTGGWVFYTPFKWMDAVVESLDSRMSFNGTSWVSFGLLMKDTGEYLRIGHWQQDITLTGTSKDTTLLIPNRSLVMAVNMRVMTAVTGATAINIGVVGDLTRYGSNLGIALDTTNIGMSYHPISYYADTAIRISAVSGTFTAGIVRITAQYFEPHGPWSW